MPEGAAPGRVAGSPVVSLRSTTATQTHSSATTKQGGWGSMPQHPQLGSPVVSLRSTTATQTHSSPTAEQGGWGSMPQRPQLGSPVVSLRSTTATQTHSRPTAEQGGWGSMPQRPQLGSPVVSLRSTTATQPFNLEAPTPGEFDRESNRRSDFPRTSPHLTSASRWPSLQGHAARGSCERSRSSTSGFGVPGCCDRIRHLIARTSVRSAYLVVA